MGANHIYPAVEDKGKKEEKEKEKTHHPGGSEGGAWSGPASEGEAWRGGILGDGG